MKTLTYLLFVLAGAAFASAAVRPVSSTINAVTVYADRAIVTRSASIELTAGNAEVVFESLPASLDDRSIQVSGRGDAEATILDVTPREVFVDETPDARVKELEDRLVGLARQIQQLDDRNATLGEQREFVKRILTASTTPGSGPDRSETSLPSLEGWQQLLGFAGTTLNGIAADGRSLQVQREDLVRQQDTLRGQLAALRTRGQRSTKSVTIRLAARASGSLELELHYSVPGASWVPAYDARLHSSQRVIELSYQGVVRQNTGEDWNNVALTLSTARPALGGAAPDPTPWIVQVGRPPSPALFARGSTSGPTDEEVIRLNPFEVVESRNDSFRAMSAGSGSRTSLSESPPPPAAIVFANTQLASSITSATFSVSTPVTLASDNAPQKVPVMNNRLSAELEYESTPKAAETMYLVARAANTTGVPLLAGNVNSYLDDTFVATSPMNTVMPGEKVDLPFGADEGVAVKRQVVNRFTEETGLGNHGRRVTYDYLVTITNNKRTPEKVSFREPVPTSRNERIVVRLGSPAERDLGSADRPKEVTRDSDGNLCWKLDLEPGEKREIPIKFAIEFPAEIPVAGLE